MAAGRCSCATGATCGVSAHHLDRADRWFVRYGPATVFFTRMMPGIRTFISLPAGIAKMPFAKFLLYSALGSVIWNAGLAYLGYAAGKAAGEDPWGTLQETFSRYNHIFYIVLGVVVLALIGWGCGAGAGGATGRPGSRRTRLSPRTGPWRGRAWSALPAD